MSTDTRSTNEIERDIETERAALAASLDALQNRFSVEGITRQITEELSRHGGDIGRSVTRSVKENPVALALTGIGLAWLIYGDSNRSGRNAYTAGAPSSDIAVAARQAGSSVGDTAHSATSAARQAGSSVGDAVHSATSAASGGLSNAASAASERWDRMKDSAGEYDRRTRASAEDLRRRIWEGTEHLSEEARNRVVAAREAAHQAQHEWERRYGTAKKDVTQFFNDQPLVMGALAMAVGAAFGAALPKSQMEDDTFGEASDHLFAEAERVFREETDKARSVVKAAASEAEKEKEKADASAPDGRTAVQAIVDEAKEATKRVAKKAGAEAEKQELGKPTVG